MTITADPQLAIGAQTLGHTQIMTIPPNKILCYVPADTVIPARKPNGELATWATGIPVGILLDSNLVAWGKKKGSKFKWIQLTVFELVEAEEQLTDTQREKLRKVLVSHASRTWRKQWIESTRTYIYTHHNQRCLNWTPIAEGALKNDHTVH